MTIPLLFGALLFILSSVLFISQGPDWIVCLVSVGGAVWTARLLTGKEKVLVAREDKS